MGTEEEGPSSSRLTARTRFGRRMRALRASRSTPSDAVPGQAAAAALSPVRTAVRREFQWRTAGTPGAGSSADVGRGRGIGMGRRMECRSADKSGTVFSPTFPLVLSSCLLATGSVLREEDFSSAEHSGGRRGAQRDITSAEDAEDAEDGLAGDGSGGNGRRAPHRWSEGRDKARDASNGEGSAVITSGTEGSGRAEERPKALPESNEVAGTQAVDENRGGTLLLPASDASPTFGLPATLESVGFSAGVAAGNRQRSSGETAGRPKE